jgi:putative FmdB family regulatory protein
MPIYAYRCSACGHAQDVLQKISDPLLTHCPACGQATFAKQVTAAGFQLKGSGWYATDFRNGSQPNKAAASDGEAAKEAGKGDEKAADKLDGKSGDKPADKTPKTGQDGAKSAAGAAGAKPAADKGGATAASPAAPAGQG